MPQNALSAPASMLVGHYNTETNPSGAITPTYASGTQFYSGGKATFEDIAGAKTAKYYNDNLGSLKLPKSQLINFKVLGNKPSVRVGNQIYIDAIIDSLDKSASNLDLDKAVSNFIDANVLREITEDFQLTLPSGMIDVKERELKENIELLKARVNRLNVDKKIKDQILAFGMTRILERASEGLTTTDTMTGAQIRDNERASVIQAENGSEAPTTAIMRPTRKPMEAGEGDGSVVSMTRSSVSQRKVKGKEQALSENQSTPIITAGAGTLYAQYAEKAGGISSASTAIGSDINPVVMSGSNSLLSIYENPAELKGRTIKRRQRTTPRGESLATISVGQPSRMEDVKGTPGRPRKDPEVKAVRAKSKATAGQGVDAAMINVMRVSRGEKPIKSRKIETKPRKAGASEKK
jgi:hypothetical protein